MQKYYQAYDERYKNVHKLGHLWFSTEPTPEVLNWVQAKAIPLSEPILEVGCGEGRDILYLAGQGYTMVGLDISPQAIRKCEEIAEQSNLCVEWKTCDALEMSVQLRDRYRWLYSVSTLHMLVDSADRKRFLAELYNMLTPGGQALLVSKGDGITERASDPTQAFNLEERVLQHDEEVKVKVTSTTYRAINWENHLRELVDAGFTIEQRLDTVNEEYQQCMTVYLKR